MATTHDNISKLYKAFSAKYDNFKTEDEFRTWVSTADAQKMQKLYDAFSAKYDNFTSVDQLKTYVGWKEPHEEASVKQQAPTSVVQEKPEQEAAVEGDRRGDASTHSEPQGESNEGRVAPWEGNLSQGLLYEEFKPAGNSNGQRVANSEQAIDHVPEAVSESAAQEEKPVQEAAVQTNAEAGSAEDVAQAGKWVPHYELDTSFHGNTGLGRTMKGSIDNSFDRSRRINSQRRKAAEEAAKKKAELDKVVYGDETPTPEQRAEVDKIWRDAMQTDPLYDDRGRLVDTEGYLVDDRGMSTKEYGDFSKTFAPHKKSRGEKLLEKSGEVFQGKDVKPKEDSQFNRYLKANGVDRYFAKQREKEVELTLEELRNVNMQQVSDLTANIDKAIEESKARGVEEYTKEAKEHPYLSAAVHELNKGSDPNSVAKAFDIARYGAAGMSMSGSERKTLDELYVAQDAMRNSRRIIAEAEHNAQRGTLGKWLESSFAGGLGRGFGQKLFDVKTWDFGMRDMVEVAILTNTLEAWDKGEQLTPSQQMVLDAKAVELATMAYFGSDLGRGYKAGQVTAEALPFMLEMCINPLAGTGKSAQSILTRYALKRFGKESLRRNARKYAVSRMTARVVGDIAGSTGMAATTGALRTAADMGERMHGEIQYKLDDTGRVVFSGHTQGEGALPAFFKALGSTTIENASEMWGAYLEAMKLGKIGRAVSGSKVGKALRLDRVEKFVDNLNASDLAKSVNEFASATQWHGPINEYVEEVMGNLANALTVGDMTLDTAENTGVFNLDLNIDTFLGVGVMGGAMSTVKTMGYRSQQSRAERSYEDAMRECERVMGDKWQNVSAGMLSDDEGVRKQTLAGILLDKSYSKEQKRCALDVVGSRSYLDGVRMGVEKKVGESVQQLIDEHVTEEMKVSHRLTQAYDEGYMSASGLNLVMRKMRDNLARVVGEDANDIVPTHEDVASRAEQWYSDWVGAGGTVSGAIERMRAEGSSEEDIEAALKLAESVREYQGMSEAISDMIRDADRRFGERVKSCVNADGCLELVRLDTDKKVAVRSGEIVFNADGSVDKDRSETIVVCDLETGELEMLPSERVMERVEWHDQQGVQDIIAAMHEVMLQDIKDRAYGRVNLSVGSIVAVSTDGAEGKVIGVNGNSVELEFEDGSRDVIGADHLQDVLDGIIEQDYASAKQQAPQAEGEYENEEISEYDKPRENEEKGNEDVQATINELSVGDRVSGYGGQGTVTQINGDGSVEIQFENGQVYYYYAGRDGILQGLWKDGASEPIEERPERSADEAMSPETSDQGGEAADHAEESNNDVDFERAGYIRFADENGDEVDGYLTGYRDPETGKVEYYKEGEWRLHYATDDEMRAMVKEYKPDESAAVEEDRRGDASAHSEPQGESEESGELTDTDGIVLQAGDMITDGTRTGRVTGNMATPTMHEIEWSDGTHTGMNNRMLESGGYRKGAVESAPAESRRVPDGMTADRTIAIAQRDGSTREYTVAKDQSGNQYVVDEQGFMWGHDGNGENMKPYRPGENVAEWTDEQLARLSQPAQPSDAVPEQPEIVPTTAESGENAANIVPNPAETVLTEQPAAEPTPLQRVPKDANGEPKFEATDHETAWDALVEYSEGDAGTAKEIADAMVEEKKKALDKAQKLKLKGKTPAEMLASRKANAAELGKAQHEFDQWQRIAGVEQRRKEAEAALKAAEAEAVARREAEAEAKRREDLGLEMIEDDYEPMDATEYAAKLFGGRHGVKITPESYRAETGYGIGEQRELVGLLASAKNGGVTIMEAAKMLCEGEYGERFFPGKDDHTAREAILEVLQSGNPRRYVRERREELARRIEEENRQSEERAAQEMYHMSVNDYEAYEEDMYSRAQESWRDYDENEFNGIVADDYARNPGYYNHIDREDNGYRESEADESAGEGPGDGSSNSILPRERTANGGAVGKGVAWESTGEAGRWSSSTDQDGAIPGGASPGETGLGTFGEKYTQFKGKSREAVTYLLAKRSGEATGALHHKDVGDIDLVWGEEGTGHSDGYGLAKLAKYHPEVLFNLQEILDDMVVTKRSENRVQLESDKYQAAVRLTWDDKKKTWLLTMFEKKNSVPDNTTDTVETLSGNGNDTATPENTVSEGKDSDFLGDKQGNGEKDEQIKRLLKERDLLIEASIRYQGNDFNSQMERLKLDHEIEKINKRLEQLGYEVEAPEDEIHFDGFDEPTVQAAIESASAEVDSNPTEAQKEAGNYKKGHVKVADLDITIENPKGSTRSGVDADGKEWSIEMKHTYGYIRGTKGKDGDHIDVYLADDMDAWDGKNVYVIDQTNPDGSFDEHKVMIGFHDDGAAWDAYYESYSPEWWEARKNAIPKMTPCPIGEFKDWLSVKTKKSKPFAEYGWVDDMLAQQREELYTEPAETPFTPADAAPYFGKKFTAGVNEWTISGYDGATGKFIAKQQDGVTRQLPADVVRDNIKLDKAEPAAQEPEQVAPRTEGYSIEKRQDTRDGSDLYAVKFDERVSREEFKGQREIAKKFNGYWSNFGKKGFLFKSEEAAHDFAETVMGRTDTEVEEEAPLSIKDVAPDTKVDRPAVSSVDVMGLMGAVSKATQATQKDGKPRGVKLSDHSTPIEPPTKEKFVLDEDADEFNRLADELRSLLGGDTVSEGQAEYGKRKGKVNATDPRIISVGSQMSYLLLKAGVRTFPDYCEKMVGKMGDIIRPYLRPLYYFTAGLDEVIENGWSDEMDDRKSVNAFDVDNFDKSKPQGIIETAERISAETEIQRGTETITENLKKQRNEKKRQQAEQRAADTEAIASQAETVADEISSGTAGISTEEEARAAADRIDEQLVAVDKQLDEVGTGRRYTSGTEVDLKDGRVVRIDVAVEVGEQIGAATFSRPRIERYYGTEVGTGKSVDFTPDKVDVEMTAARIERRAKEQEQRERAWAARQRRPKEWFNLREGDKVMYKGKECTVHDFEGYGDDKPSLDTGFAPGLYEVAEWKDISPVKDDDYVAMAEKVAAETEEKPTKPKKSKKKEVTSQQSLFGGLFDMPEDKKPAEKKTADPATEAIEKALAGDLDAVKPQKTTTDEQTIVQTGTSVAKRERGHQPRQDEPLGEGEQPTAERPDGRGVAGRDREHTMPDTERSAGVPQSRQGKQDVAAGGRQPNEQGLTATKPKNLGNNHAERGVDYAPKGVNARIEANIKAIETMQRLMQEGEKATAEDMELLRRYSGWGGLGSAFNEKIGWSDNPINKRLRTLLSEEEYNAAVMSRNSAYFTPAPIIDNMWDIARAMGFTGGNVLEGSAGIGNIIGLMPKDMSERSDIHAVEIDPTTGNMLKLLYPDANVSVQGFETVAIPNGSVDLAITNVPFVTGLHVMDTSGDSDLSKKFRNIHDFCIAKNVRKLREGGIGIFITSIGTLDSSKKLRDWLVSGEGNADIVGAFRMNNDTFSGTGVTSDIIVVRKRVNGQKSANAIDVSTVSAERTVEYDDGGRKTKTLPVEYNRYFIEHPENMAGQMMYRFERGETYQPTSRGLFPKPGVDQDKELTRWASQFADMDWEGREAGHPIVDDTKAYESLGAGVKEGSMLIDSNGALCVAQRGRAVPIKVNANKVKGHSKAECFESYQAIKKALADVLEYQTTNHGDAGLKPLLAALNKAYDDFVGTYGGLNRNTSISFLRNDVDFPGIMALETYEERTAKDGKKTLCLPKFSDAGLRWCRFS